LIFNRNKDFAKKRNEYNCKDPLHYMGNSSQEKVL